VGVQTPHNNASAHNATRTCASANVQRSHEQFWRQTTTGTTRAVLPLCCDGCGRYRTSVAYDDVIRCDGRARIRPWHAFCWSGVHTSGWDLRHRRLHVTLWVAQLVARSQRGTAAVTATRRCELRDRHRGRRCRAGR
jgi:hypothetical protein